MTAGDVEQHTLGALDGGLLEQRRGDRPLRRLDRPIFTLGDTGAHQRHAHTGHDGLDVGEVDVDLTRAP